MTDLDSNVSLFVQKNILVWHGAHGHAHFSTPMYIIKCILNRDMMLM